MNLALSFKLQQDAGGNSRLRPGTAISGELDQTTLLTFKWCRRHMVNSTKHTTRRL